MIFMLAEHLSLREKGFLSVKSVREREHHCSVYAHALDFSFDRADYVFTLTLFYPIFAEGLEACLKRITVLTW